ncbi:LolA family protein [Caminicella sporogenes]|uniref:LolA family protein n=1 Tax=Caminicella sporogenes TaxID=166485 RepID=UPI0025404246|nr:outer-membrane lipoprotein carrier protein LolA [Caminicella sporogenes]WIF95325.1 outer-membrane lipoprotein carrier protein LolA [Caminicella sporogenes]
MKYKIFLISIFIILILVGCREKSDEQLFYDVQKFITSLDSYTCTAYITIYGNKEPETYIVKQWYKAPDKYRIDIEKPEELRGKTTIYNGNKVLIRHPKIGQGWIMENYKNTVEQKMFLGYFIHNYLNNENGKIKKQTIKKIDYLLFETEIPGEHPYFNREKLWFEIKKYYPYRLQILDINDKIRVDIKYRNFEYNQKIKDDVFKIHIKN